MLFDIDQKLIVSFNLPLYYEEMNLFIIANVPACL